MSIVKEFREFAMKGNVIDLAVGVIIGAAFGKIVDSLVNDVIMPVISFLVGGKVDFSNLFFKLGSVPAGTSETYEALKKAGVPMLAYGNFLTIVINFLILAFAIFMMVRYMNKLKKAEPVAIEAITPEQEQVSLLKEIRDNLKK